jgi:hypothetical protein
VRCGDVVRVRLYERRRRAGEAAGLAGQWHGGACPPGRGRRGRGTPARRRSPRRRTGMGRGSSPPAC